MSSSAEPFPVAKPDWTDFIPADQWEVYEEVIRLAREKHIEFALGGAFAVAAYAGRWRNTKDLDFYVLPSRRLDMIAAVGKAGLEDYFDVLPYDRSWIYRSHRGSFIVDIIWAMANQRTQVDEDWLKRGPVLEVRGHPLRIVPPEEMIWGKIYILQKDRSDWTDILNIAAVSGEHIDWEHLVDCMESDLPLLRSLLSIFSWIDPSRAARLPESLWTRVKLPPPEPISEEESRQRVSYIDSRPWYIPYLAEGEEPFSASA